MIDNEQAFVYDECADIHSPTFTFFILFGYTYL